MNRSKKKPSAWLRWKGTAEAAKFLEGSPGRICLQATGRWGHRWTAGVRDRRHSQPDYTPQLDEAKILKRVRAKFWIDKSEYQWIKAEAEILDTVSFGLFLIRIEKGSRFDSSKRGSTTRSGCLNTNIK